MKRIMMLMTAALVMAAMMVASAMPAFAAVKTTLTGDDPRTCFTELQSEGCSGTFTAVGGSKDSQFNGKRTADFTFDVGTGEDRGDFSISENSQGGGKDTGGGNCTLTESGNLGDSESVVTTSEGNGSRCQ